MYFIYDFEEDTRSKMMDWWELVGCFHPEKSDCDYFSKVRDQLGNISHNEKDLKNVATWHEDAPKFALRTQIIYDEDLRVINLSEIKQALRVYKVPVAKYEPFWWRGSQYTFEFRREPVPLVGARRSSYYRSRVKKNKNYVAQFYEDTDLFPHESVKEKRLFVSSWNDYFNCGKHTKDWKHQKKKKQWM